MILKHKTPHEQHGTKNIDFSIGTLLTMRFYGVQHLVTLFHRQDTILAPLFHPTLEQS
jgi:hypothetical protein